MPPMPPVDREGPNQDRSFRDEAMRPSENERGLSVGSLCATSDIIGARICRLVSIVDVVFDRTGGCRLG